LRPVDRKAAAARRRCAIGGGPTVAIGGAIVPLLVYAALCRGASDFARRDRVLAVATGAAAVVLVWAVATRLLLVLPVSPRRSPILAAFTYAAGLEETVKLLGLVILWRFMRAHSARDLLPAATGIACGFAAAETILTFWAAHYPMLAFVERVFLALTAHMAYAAIMAGVLGRIDPPFGAGGLLLALVAAIVCHGVYDALSFAGLHELAWLMAALSAAVTAAAWWRHRRRS
jgi:hypothetical protein